MTITVPNSTITQILDNDSKPRPSKAAWFQNFNTTPIYIAPFIPGQIGEQTEDFTQSTVSASSFMLAPSADGVTPTTLIFDQLALVGAKWYAWQTSGSVNISCGRW